MNRSYEILHADCLREMRHMDDDNEGFDCVFADPPDNIGLKYEHHDDNLPVADYTDWLENIVWAMTAIAPTVWVSFNTRWVVAMGGIAERFLCSKREWELKPCVQTFTFGQHNNSDFGNNHRPLWRFKHEDAPLYPDAIRVESERQKAGDKRANPEGRVPGDVFDFPRVTGNSKQRRSWHPTQLNEGLVERCLKMSTRPGDIVLDPFAGTGTTLRVCKRLGLSCTLIEKDSTYCEEIRKEHNL